MTSLQRKFKSLNKLLVSNKITKPVKLGDKILLLATAPCAADFFEYESVREQFKDYDLAVINYMIVYSQKEVFALKPKYIIMMDPIFYDDAGHPDFELNPEKERVGKILEQIDWECYIVTSVLQDFEFKNDNVKYIHLSCFSRPYNKIFYPLYKRNLLNFGVFNVIHGAIYFAVTFGYKNIAILGCTYKHLQLFMDVDGLHILEHNHYYNLERDEIIIPNEELMNRKESYTMWLNKRAYQSAKMLWNLKQYAEDNQAEMINYSEGSEIDSIKMGRLNKTK